MRATASQRAASKRRTRSIPRASWRPSRRPSLPRAAHGRCRRPPLPSRRASRRRRACARTRVQEHPHAARAALTVRRAPIRRNLEAARGRGVTLTLTAFLLRAAALALGGHPPFSAGLDPAAGELILKRYV